MLLMELHGWDSPRMLDDLPLQADLLAPQKNYYRRLLSMCLGSRCYVKVL